MNEGRGQQTNGNETIQASRLGEDLADDLVGSGVTRTKRRLDLSEMCAHPSNNQEGQANIEDQ